MLYPATDVPPIPCPGDQPNLEDRLDWEENHRERQAFDAACKTLWAAYTVLTIAGPAGLTWAV